MLESLRFRGFEPARIIDVGAATGAWTRKVMKIWPEAQYLLVDPLEEHREALEAMAQQHANVAFANVAAGEHHEWREIGVPSKPTGSSFHMIDVPEAPTTPQQVEIVPIDALAPAKHFTPVDLLKVDTQGFEYWVIEGARETLRDCRAVILELQFHRYTPGMRLLPEVAGHMSELGFELHAIMDPFRREWSGAMGQCDALFVPKGDPLTDQRWYLYPDTGTLFRSDGPPPASGG